MANAMYDSLVYVMSYENEVLSEGYSGFILEENAEGTCFVVYKEIVEGNDVERRFVLPSGTEDAFLASAKRFENFFERQKKLFELVLMAEILLADKNEEALRAICNGIYQIPENYIDFVAMNMTKTQFFNHAKQRVLNTLAA